MLSGVPRWVRWPVLPAALLAAAVAVSVSIGQPPPADYASGVSVPISAAIDAPADLGSLLFVSAGALDRYDVRTGAVVPVDLPHGQLALRAWPMPGTDVVLTEQAPAPVIGQPVGPGQPATPGPNGTATPGPTPGSTPGTPGTQGTSGAGGAPTSPVVPLGTAPPAPALPRPGTAGAGGTGHTATGSATASTARAVPRTSVYAIRRGGATVRLGAATAAVPAADGTHVWLLRGDVARLVGLDGRVTPTWVRVPPGYHLVGATADGPLATIGGAQPLTVLLPADGGLPRWLASAEALDVARGVLLVHDDHRVGSLRLDTGVLHWLPGLSAVRITGPGTLSDSAGSFAVQARVNDHARLVVGSMKAAATGDLHVVALEGGDALDHPPGPVWTADGRVLGVRPDGRMVIYRPGDVSASVLSAQYQADGIAAVTPANRDPGH